MANRKERLSKLEAAAAVRDTPLIHELVLFIEKQPESDQQAFWRVTHRCYAPGEKADAALHLCGGSFELLPGDLATYQRLQDAFFGNDGRPPDPTAPAPRSPAFEMA